MAFKELSDEQWGKVKAFLPVRKRPWRKKLRAGRKPVDNRICFNGILWILWSGAPWSALPEKYGKSSTVHRRLQKWASEGILEKAWHAFLAQLEEKEQIRWDECFVDGTFASAKKGAPKSERPSAGRERSLWYWLMARVLRSDFTWTRRPRLK
jgi:transposase